MCRDKLSEKDEMECVETHRRMVCRKVYGDGVMEKCTVLTSKHAFTGDCKT